MRLALLACAALTVAACSYTWHEFDIAKPTKVAEVMPPPENTPGQSIAPYTGKPKYLAAARPLQATRSKETCATDNPCAVRSQTCEDRLRAVLASLDGQILALSTPPTELELSTLRMQVEQLKPLLAPYQDITSEGDELSSVIDKLPSLTKIELGPARRRLTELSDLIRVQLAAGD